MKASNFIVRIPEPCHEDWNKMQPDEKGRFCLSCSKSVVDFTGKTDTEIRDILLENSEKKICGHFYKSQVDRPLNLSVNYQFVQSSGFRSRFAVALMIVFGTMLFSCTGEHGDKIGTIKVQGFEETKSTLKGEVDRSIELNDLIQQPDSVIDNILVDGDVNFEEVAGLMQVMPAPDSIPHISDTMPPLNNCTGLPKNEERLMGKPSMMGGPKIDWEDMQLRGDTVLNQDKPQDMPPLNLAPSDRVEVFPNPSAGSFTVSYELREPADISISVLDEKGTKVKGIAEVKNQHSGKYRIPFDLTDKPGGLYIVQTIIAGNRSGNRIIVQK